jgi:hypothetical protein
MDEPFIAMTDGPTVEIPAAVVAVRTAVSDAARRLVGVPDDALAREWRWRDGEQEIRYGFYHAAEVLEAASGAVGRTLAEAAVEVPSGARHAAPSTAARWDLHGLLAPLTDADLDADPGGDEWTIRQTIAHIVNGQRAYAWFTAWWLQRAGEELLPKVPDDALPTFPDEESEGIGGLDEIEARLDAILDLAMGRLGSLDDDRLAVPARWSGYPVTVAFRMGRWSSHIREHTIQVEKTLVMLGRSMTETDRLVRHVLARYGELEAVVFGVPAEALERPGTDRRTATGIIAAAAEEVDRVAGEILEGAAARA